jgi:hypothetical protein
VSARAESHRLTEVYRSRVATLRSAVTLAARSSWPTIAELDGSSWEVRTSSTLARAQLQGIRLAAGYLTAYLRSESGRARAISFDPGRYTGVSRDGRPLAEALRSPIIGTLGKLKEGSAPSEALAFGLERALRMVAFEVTQTPREALLTAIEADERFSGFQRATKGTCGACLDLSGNGGPRFEVHPNCECVPEPLVRGVPNLYPVPTGVELFAQKSPAEQDAALGPEAAQKVRAGELSLSELAGHSNQHEQQDFITQRPVEAATGD